MKATISYPKGLSAKEQENLKELLQVLEKAPRVQRKEMLKISLPSTLTEEERKKAVKSIMGPMKMAREAMIFDTVVEETSVEEVEETTVEVSSRFRK